MMFKTRLLYSGRYLSANVNTLYLGFPVIYLIGEAVGRPELDLGSFSASIPF
jgi:hypothetical protein